MSLEKILRFLMICFCNQYSIYHFEKKRKNIYIYIYYIAHRRKMFISSERFLLVHDFLTCFIDWDFCCWHRFPSRVFSKGRRMTSTTRQPNKFFPWVNKVTTNSDLIDFVYSSLFLHCPLKTYLMLHANHGEVKILSSWYCNTVFVNTISPRTT